MNPDIESVQKSVGSDLIAGVQLPEFPDEPLRFWIVDQRGSGAPVFLVLDEESALDIGRFWESTIALRGPELPTR